jgi:hypothetical protein
MSSENDYQLTISRDDFSKLLTLLKVFENYCTDCDIQSGFLRCRTNDRQAVISMDLSSILETQPLQFTLVKNKIGLMKTFEVDDNVQLDDKDIILVSNESNYEIKDPFSKMIFRKPIQQYLDNKYIPDDEFATMIRCSEENLIFSYDINNYLKKRISNITLGFQSDIIKCEIIESAGRLSAETRNHEDSSLLVKDIVLNNEVSDREFRMIAMPFVLDIASDMKFSVYQTSTDVYMCKFEQAYYGVPIAVYSQVKVNTL